MNHEPKLEIIDQKDIEAIKATMPAPEDDSARESQATALVKFVCGRGELFHDDNRAPCITLADNGLTLRIGGSTFKDWLSSNFYAAEQKAPRDQSIKEASGVLSGMARHQGEQHRVFLRVGAAGGAYYIDLCEPTTARAIELKPGSWCVVDKPSVRFTRTEAMQPIPCPAHAGDMRKLWDAANIPDNRRLLVTTWLIDALRTDTPYPILEFMGEAGSAKSTTHTMLKRLIDPNAADLRSPPKVTEDVFVSAGVNFIVSYENVSFLPAPMQDALCVLATGGGTAKRKLYSDTDESVISVKRPVIINGISANVSAHDLADRAISIELPRIAERKASSGLMDAYEHDRPVILGGLLSIAAKALAHLPQIKIPSEQRPRMLEFYQLGLAVGHVLKRDFQAEFAAVKTESAGRTLDASPVATALIDWFNANGKRTTELSAKALMQAVEQHKPDYAEAWPKSPKGFADALRRAAPTLRQVGIECQLNDKGGHDNVRKWRVTEIKSQTTSATSATSANDPKNADMRTLRSTFESNSLASEADTQPAPSPEVF